MSLLINSSLLSLVLALMSFAGVIYQLILLYCANHNISHLLYFIPVSSQVSIYSQRIWIYLFLGIMFILIARLFNWATVEVSRSFYRLYTSAVDLFRFKILEGFHLPLPSDSIGEFEVWKSVNRFVGAGFQEYSPMPEFTKQNCKLVYDRMVEKPISRNPYEINLQIKNNEIRTIEEMLRTRSIAQQYKHKRKNVFHRRMKNQR